jgi:hypothetical protein
MAEKFSHILVLFLAVFGFPLQYFLVETIFPRSFPAQESGCEFNLGIDAECSPVFASKKNQEKGALTSAPSSGEADFLKRF